VVVVVVVVVVVAGAVVVVVVVLAAIVVVVTAVVPDAYELPAGGPEEAVAASHVLPEHPASQTKGAVVCDTIPNTPLVEDVLVEEARYITPATSFIMISLGPAE
jgi:hypothetical protein